jgi:hypothetical protein
MRGLVKAVSRKKLFLKNRFFYDAFLSRLAESWNWASLADSWDPASPPSPER